MTRILPERTAEAWTTAYITRWDPTAALWAPTQRDPRNWDLSARSGRATHFVFEYKGVEGFPEPYVPINRKQLRAYADFNANLGATLIWYLLPAWTFDVRRGQILPPETEYRVVHATDPRPSWRGGTIRPEPALAANAPSLRNEMALARGCESYFYVADPQHLADDPRIHRFPGWGGPWGFRVDLIRELAEGLTLEHFLHLAQSGALGVSGWQLLDRPSNEEHGPSKSPRQLPEHHTTAYAVDQIDER